MKKTLLLILVLIVSNSIFAQRYNIECTPCEVKRNVPCSTCPGGIKYSETAFEGLTVNGKPLVHAPYNVHLSNDKFHFQPIDATKDSWSVDKVFINRFNGIKVSSWSRNALRDSLINCGKPWLNAGSSGGGGEIPDNELIESITYVSGVLTITEGGVPTSITIPDDDNQTLSIVDNSDGSVNITISDGNTTSLDICQIVADNCPNIDDQQISITDNANGTVNVNLTGDTPSSAVIDLCAIIAANCNPSLSYNDVTNELTFTDVAGNSNSITLNTADGSETIINSGTNTNITGTGTNGDPYVINATDTDDQTLSIINNNDGSVDIAISEGNTTSLDICQIVADNCPHIDNQQISVTDNANGTVNINITGDTPSTDVIDICGIVASSCNASVSYNEVSSTLTFNDNSGTANNVDLSSLLSTVTDTNNNTNVQTIATHEAGGTTVNIEETVTPTINSTQGSDVIGTQHMDESGNTYYQGIDTIFNADGTMNLIITMGTQDPLSIPLCATCNSIEIQEDSIIVQLENGVEVDRDTIRSGGSGATSSLIANADGTYIHDDGDGNMQVIGYDLTRDSVVVDTLRTKFTDTLKTTQGIVVAAIDRYETFPTALHLRDIDGVLGRIIGTHGFWKYGDAGAAWYQVQLTGTDNGMTVFRMKNGLFAHLMPNFDGSIHLAQTGCVIDDGIDDRLRIQAALDRAYELKTNPITSMVTGQYLCNDSLIVRSNQYLLFGDSTVFRSESNINHMLITTEGSVFNIGQHENITINGGIWDNNNPTGSGRIGGASQASLYGVAIFNCEKCDFINMEMHEANKYSYGVGGLVDCTFENIRLETDSDGIHIDGPANNVLVNNIVGSTGDDFIALSGRNYTNNDFTEGDIEQVVISNIKANVTGTKGNLVALFPGNDGLGGPGTKNYKFSKISIKNIKGESLNADLISIDEYGIVGDPTNGSSAGGVIDGLLIENIAGKPGSQFMISMSLDTVYNMVVRDVFPTDNLAKIRISRTRVENSSFENLHFNGDNASPIIELSGGMTFDGLAFDKFHGRLTNGTRFFQVESDGLYSRLNITNSVFINEAGNAAGEIYIDMDSLNLQLHNNYFEGMTYATRINGQGVDVKISECEYVNAARVINDVTASTTMRVFPTSYTYIGFDQKFAFGEVNPNTIILEHPSDNMGGYQILSANYTIPTNYPTGTWRYYYNDSPTSITVSVSSGLINGAPSITLAPNTGSDFKKVSSTNWTMSNVNSISNFFRDVTTGEKGDDVAADIYHSGNILINRTTNVDPNFGLQINNKTAYIRNTTGTPSAFVTGASTGSSALSLVSQEASGTGPAMQVTNQGSNVGLIVRNQTNASGAIALQVENLNQADGIITPSINISSRLGNGATGSSDLFGSAINFNLNDAIGASIGAGVFQSYWEDATNRNSIVNINANGAGNLSDPGLQVYGNFSNVARSRIVSNHDVQIGASLYGSIVVYNSTTVIEDGYHTVILDGSSVNMDCTLPDASLVKNQGRIIKIKPIDVTNTITLLIGGTGGTLEGNTSFVFANTEGITIQALSDGTNRWIIL